MLPQIHIILGIGYFGLSSTDDPSKRGVMGDVAASANDPIFLSHHAMVDCIFETWLQQNPNANYPTSADIPQGHQMQDYIVPFFPLYKHKDMLLTADRFGYKCKITPENQPPDIGVVISLTIVAIVVFAILCIVGGYVGFKYWYKKTKSKNTSDSIASIECISKYGSTPKTLMLQSKEDR